MDQSIKFTNMNSLNQKWNFSADMLVHFARPLILNYFIWQRRRHAIPVGFVRSKR